MLSFVFLLYALVKPNRLFPNDKNPDLPPPGEGVVAFTILASARCRLSCLAY